MTDVPDYVPINQAHWTEANAQYTDGKARESWAAESITWGVFALPEESVRALPDVAGKEIIELGCGTGYFGAWLKRRGAVRVVGVDYGTNVLEQLRRPQLGLHKLEWPAQEGEGASVEFAIGHGDMFKLLRSSGFEVTDLIELFVPADTIDHPSRFYKWVPIDWAKQWPAEEIWRARKR